MAACALAWRVCPRNLGPRPLHIAFQCSTLAASRPERAQVAPRLQTSHQRPLPCSNELGSGLQQLLQQQHSDWQAGSSAAARPAVWRRAAAAADCGSHARRSDRHSSHAASGGLWCEAQLCMRGRARWAVQGAVAATGRPPAARRPARRPQCPSPAFSTALPRSPRPCSGGARRGGGIHWAEHRCRHPRAANRACHTGRRCRHASGAHGPRARRQPACIWDAPLPV